MTNPAYDRVKSWLTGKISQYAHRVADAFGEGSSDFPDALRDYTFDQLVYEGGEEAEAFRLLHQDKQEQIVSAICGSISI